MDCLGPPIHLSFRKGLAKTKVILNSIIWMQDHRSNVTSSPNPARDVDGGSSVPSRLRRRQSYVFCGISMFIYIFLIGWVCSIEKILGLLLLVSSLSLPWPVTLGLVSFPGVQMAVLIRALSSQACQCPQGSPRLQGLLLSFCSLWMPLLLSFSCSYFLAGKLW